MALQGTIDGFGVVDVLQLLSTSQKSGRLVIEGDRGVGQLWVVDGAVTAGNVRGHDVADATEIVFELLRFAEGSFLFEPGAAVPAGFEPAAVPGALEEAGERLRRWLAIEAVVPSVAHRLLLRPDLPDDEVTLGAADWQVVVAAGAGASVAQFAEVTDVDEFVATLQRVRRGGTALDPVVVSRLLAAEPADGPLESLTPREREVLQLIAEGRSNPAIADRLGITLRSTEKHVTSIFAKLGLPDTGTEHRRVLAVLRFLRG